MKNKKRIAALAAAVLMAALLCVPASAATTGAGNVASAVQQTWTGVSGQIKTVVNSVVFPALDMILAIAFFCKLSMAFFDYRKHGQFEWAGPAILFACLLFTLTAPSYIWGIVGI